jgi:hypothetical protein
MMFLRASGRWDILHRRHSRSRRLLLGESFHENRLQGQCHMHCFVVGEVFCF